MFAALAEAALIEHADVFSLIPPERRPALAEYLVAVASEGLPVLPSTTPRSAGLLAAALVAQGHEDQHDHALTPPTLVPRRRWPRGDDCRSAGGRPR